VGQLKRKGRKPARRRRNPATKLQEGVLESFAGDMMVQTALHTHNATFLEKSLLVAATWV